MHAALRTLALPLALRVAEPCRGAWQRRLFSAAGRWRHAPRSNPPLPAHPLTCPPFRPVAAKKSSEEQRTRLGQPSLTSPALRPARLQVTGVIVAQHLICLAAPFTFTWPAFYWGLALLCTVR